MPAGDYFLGLSIADGGFGSRLPRSLCSTGLITMSFGLAYQYMVTQLGWTPKAMRISEETVGRRTLFPQWGE